MHYTFYFFVYVQIQKNQNKKFPEKKKRMQKRIQKDVVENCSIK